MPARIAALAPRLEEPSPPGPGRPAAVAVGAAVAAAAALAAFATVQHRPAVAGLPQLLELAVLAQALHLMPWRLPSSGRVSLAGLPLAALGLLQPAPAVMLAAWLSAWDGRRGAGAGLALVRSGAVLSLAHGSAALAAALVPASTLALAPRTVVYAAVAAAVQLGLGLALPSAQRGRAGPGRRFGPAARPVLSRAGIGVVVLLGGGLLAAALGQPAGYLLAPITLLFAWSLKRNVEDAERVRRLWAQATHDPLTGLLNRRGLDAELARLRAGGRVRSLALIALDVDHFKSVNDRHGHATGDRLLVALAEIARRGVRAGDLAARLGGEEFVIVAPGAPPGRAVEIAERVRSQLAAADLLPERVTASAGVVVGTTRISPERLLEAADAALYEAKRAGRDRVRVGPPFQLDVPGAAGCEERRVRVEVGVPAE